MPITPNLPKGMRDFLPEDVLARNRVQQIIREAFERFGFVPISTPAIERIEILTGKAGDESDNLTFKILKRGEGESAGEVDLGLRYDLTVPLARFMAMHNEISLPFKRYQMERVWRAERPQRGRYREFIQCDADIVGCSSIYADSEIVALIYTILADLGFAKFHIRLNHRALIDAYIEQAGIPKDLAGITAIIIDKMDKIGIEGVLKDLSGRGISTESMSRLEKLLVIDGDNSNRLTFMEDFIGKHEKGRESIAELKDMLAILSGMEIPMTRLRYDPFLIRGMGYYTGPVFESSVEEPKVGSLTGGGRYDNLIGIFKGETIPATGTTIGLERIVEVLRETSRMPKPRTNTHVIVTVFNQEMAGASLALTTELRKAGLGCEMFLQPGEKLAKQLHYADERGVRLAVILGPDEMGRGTVVLRDLSTREQFDVPRADLYWKIADILNL